MISAAVQNHFGAKFESAKVEALEPRRMLAFGKTDASFADAGRAVLPMLDSAATPQVQDLLVSAGRIYAAGDAGFVRYNSDGSADAGFGSAGRVPLAGVSFRSEAIDSSGNLYALIAGSAPRRLPPTATGLRRPTRRTWPL